ncbi:GNAT family N-acetyltransferase [Catellatospora sp. KI3]|uniref:GNAT family N-acetyltransferase n=1 Tax=Catellatospora sp. KI3 TaxID=3041620 RepID=UPI002482A045|nr:GNAT family N-acetyltransferase [Catellatospora sp. KI3]MDI1465951.1 GNAT family N-acetyltransferase [Catellatospora sp. KI3]
METTKQLHVRSATAADVPAVVALVESAYRGESSRAGWTTEADLLDGQRTDADAVTGMLGGDGSRVLLFERDGALVACCHVQRREGYGYFGMFSVRPELQGGGVGRAVLERAEQTARQEWSATEMHMTVLVQRAELLAWYERRGYRRTGRHYPFPYGDPRFGLPKRDDLEFELLVKEL